jgi:peptidoglycan/LPS O-acetylase OafA/YrhL
MWVYLAFVQGFWMTTTHSIGAHWLAPTWTLAVEEHFYLLAPATIVFLPRRALVWLLSAVCVAAPALRAWAAVNGPTAHMAMLTLLPGRADLLAFGILAAVLFKTEIWKRVLLPLRLAPLLSLVATIALGALSDNALYVLGPSIMGIGSACLIICLAGDAPEAETFKSKTLRFFGDNAYCLYLVHLPVLGLMHGLLLGAVPDVVSGAQWLVTIAALPVSVVVGRAATKFIEEPLTRRGRKWAWRT